ncbi:hypothetical protein DPEC_G00325960 [Dallia pectoralis]|uniref:Uncharacterized protein n=1 Tax=Dallia pectoralis TaxID=75939 RepID=A0ACC2F7T1_DALPE|nr:hypothetical protein DPEC_G00325960 [Dallia pectoralis]
MSLPRKEQIRSDELPCQQPGQLLSHLKVSHFLYSGVISCDMASNIVFENNNWSKDCGLIAFTIFM